MFYAGGGLLAISGRLDIGALVAVIAAYKDLPSPIKELIDWDQQRLDVQIKYEQVIDQFQLPQLIDPARQSVDNDPGPPLAGDIVASALTLLDENDQPLVRRSEEHTSELQSLMRISYAVFCLKKKIRQQITEHHTPMS